MPQRAVWRRHLGHDLGKRLIHVENPRLYPPTYAKNIIRKSPPSRTEFNQTQRRWTTSTLPLGEKPHPDQLLITRSSPSKKPTSHVGTHLAKDLAYFRTSYKIPSCTKDGIQWICVIAMRRVSQAQPHVSRNRHRTRRLLCEMS